MFDWDFYNREFTQGVTECKKERITWILRMFSAQAQYMCPQSLPKFTI